MTGRVAEAAAVSALALILTLAVAAPVLRAPSERIFGQPIVGRHHDPFTVMEQFGRPLVLSVYSQPFTDIPGAWIARASGPVAAYNWLVLVTFPLSAGAAYLLARYLALSPVGAAIAAIAFAFSPFHLAQAAYHPHVAQTEWFPLFFLALWRCLDDATPAAIGLLAASVVAVTLSNFYGGLIAAVITPAAIAAFWFFKSRSQPGSSRRLAITMGSLAAIAGAGIAYAWFVAHDVVVNRAAFGFVRDDLFRFSAKWWSYLVPPVEHPVVGGIAARIWSAADVHEGLLEQQVTLGWGLVALGIVAVFAWVIRDPSKKSVAAVPALTIVPVLAIVGFAALVCSLSPERPIGPFTFMRPSALLYRVVPMFRSYARFGVVVQLMAALLAGVGVERLWRSGARAARIACVALLALTAAEYAVWPPAMSRDVLPTQAHRWVARQADGLRVLDCAPLDFESESIEWLSGHRVFLQRAPFDDCAEPNLADKLWAAGYTHLLVRASPGGASSGSASLSGERRSASLSGERTGLQVAARFADGDVFAVTRRTVLVHTVQMTSFYGREFDGVSSWRWMGPAASWTIANTSGRPIVATAGVEMSAFHGVRRMTLLLDGAQVQTLVVEQQRGTNWIGPLMLTPGGHELAFQPADPPTVADDVMHNGDRRPLSFAFGTWQWAVEGERP